MSKEKSNKGWFGKHKVLTIVGAIVLLIIIGSAIGASNNNTTVTNTASNSTSSKSSSGSSSPTAHVGSTVDIGGSKGLAVTLNQVIDPASGADQFTSPD